MILDNYYGNVKKILYIYQNVSFQKLKCVSNQNKRNNTFYTTNKKSKMYQTDSHNMLFNKDEKFTMIYTVIRRLYR